MKFGSLCSGIEAASVAWLPLGWTCEYVAETDPFCCSVLKHHYPDVPNLGDVTAPDFISRASAYQIELLVGGTPCQSFSVAGLRKGLDDERGNLTLDYVKIVKSTKSVRFALWENVCGVLSDKTNAFGCLLAGLVGAGAPLVPGHGQKWTNAGVAAGPDGTAAWRVLDAQYFGLAQRRKRVFVLFERGAGKTGCAQALFPVPQSLRWYPPPRRQTGERVAPTVEGRAGRSGENEFATSGGLVETAPPLTGSGRGTSRAGESRGQDCVIPIQEIGKRQSGTPENGTGIGQPGDPMFTLQKSAQHGVAIGFDSKQGGDTQLGCTEDAMPPLKGQARHAVVHSLRAEGSDGSENGTGRGVPLISQCLNGGGQGGIDSETETQIPVGGIAVRRLCVMECEFLQGFPRNYTAVPHRGKPAADGPRYKSLGNSMAVNVMRYIADQIQKVHTHPT